MRRDRRARLRCRLRPVGRASMGRRGKRQTNFAHNFPRSLFETTRKRCNSNELISMFKQAAGELRAKLLRRRQDPSQANFACNSIGPKFNKLRKRCNSNELISMFEQAAGELHAKLMIDSHNWATCSNPYTTGTAQGARARRPAPPDATTQTLILRSTCVRSRSARAARRSRRSSRSPHLRRRAGRRR